jgi:hypothetical protein
MSKSKRQRGRKVTSKPSSQLGDMPPLPDTSSWQPRDSASETLQQAFLERCIGIENVIRLKVQIEKTMNIDNYDSGPGVEDIIRDEIRKIVPSRYSLRSGVINDRDGKTGGDFDIIAFNELWFPAIKAGATPESRRFHFPIEGVYGICEVKQTLNYASLDEAMRKLVICSRLNRPKTNAHRLVENRDRDDCPHGLTNSLYTAIIAADIDEGIPLDKLVERFFFINKTLKRLEVVRCLCVLGYGTVNWGFIGESNRPQAASFKRDDLFWPVFPAYWKVPLIKSAFYYFLSDFLYHLYNSVLAAEDLTEAYGHREFTVKTPSSAEIALPPDQEWMEILKHPCKNEGKS